ncbi:MAG TPA: hypothetical protein VJR89_43945 [Polyangiales bacterium]|nr:hypothetical protein [Polyangiales bacterium]
MTRSRWFFVLGLSGVAVLAVGLRLWISAHAWFGYDDFYFLEWVQSPRWSWREVFVPSKPHTIAAYRPLGLDAYFYLNFSLFGWNAFGYYASALVLQLAAAAVVFRLALQLEFGTRAASLAALFMACSGPTLTATYAVNEHNYLSAALCYALTLSLFLDYQKTDQRRALLGSSAALLIGVLSNDACITLPALLFAIAFLAAWRSNSAEARLWALVESGRTALRRTWPHLLIGGLFVDFWLCGVPRDTISWNYFYQPDFGLDTFINTFGNLVHVFGGVWRVGLFVAAAALVLWSGAGRMPSGVLPFAWLALGFVPFAVLAFSATRFALVQLPAAALCAAWLAMAVTSRLRSEWQQNVALVAIACALVPWEGALDVVRDPPGRTQREAYLVAKDVLPQQSRACITVVCGTRGLASPADCALFRDEIFGGALFNAIVPERHLEVEFQNALLDVYASSHQALQDCFRFDLRADRSLVPSEEPSASHAVLSQAD